MSFEGAMGCSAGNAKDKYFIKVDRCGLSSWKEDACKIKLA